MNDYSNLVFEIVDINTNSTPDLFINTSGITFSKRILELMNYPQFVQYSVNIENCIFAIHSCRSTDKKAFPFLKDKNRTSTLNLSNKNLREIILSLAGNIDPVKRYKVVGEYDREHKIMYFNLNNCVECEFQPKSE